MTPPFVSANVVVRSKVEPLASTTVPAPSATTVHGPVVTKSRVDDVDYW